MKKFIFYFLTVWLVLWAQIGSNHFVGDWGWAADGVLVAVLSVGLSRGPLVGEVLGFIWGLLVDASSLGALGTHAILYAGAGYLAGMLSRQLDESKLWTQAIFSFGVSCVFLALLQVFDRVFSSTSRPANWTILVQPLSNAVVAPVVFYLMRQWTRLWNLFPELD
jgi:rod shape-determining protein MreD